MWGDLYAFAHAVLQNPVPVFALLPAVFILFGAGSSLGLPLLFWHENRGKQALAGAATTWLAAEVFFVTYLLSGASDPDELVRFFGVGAAIWALAVGSRALLLEYRFRRWTDRRRGGISRMSRRRPGLGPAIREVEGAHTAELASVQVSSVPFMAGTLVAASVTAFLIYNQDTLNASIGRPLSEVLQPLLFRQPADPGLHGIAATFFVMFIAVLFVLAWLIPTRFRTPALDVSVMLASLAAGYGFLSFHLELPGLVALVVVGLVGVGGLTRRKVRVSALAVYEADLQDYPPGGDESPSKDHDPVKSPLRLRSEEKDVAAYSAEKPAPLVLVAVSGGGLRAATWTAAILAQLDTSLGFRAAARVIAGASGGMMGAAAWVGRLHSQCRGGSPPSLDWNALVDQVARDSLSDVVRQLVFRDFPYAFLPLTNLRDRGWALEQAWRHHLDGALDATFEELEEGEKKGWWPSLVFSPMLVEDGRRLLMTNLDMRSVSKNEVVWLPPVGKSSRGQLEQSSVSAYHLADLFPNAWRTFPVSTAARLSAAFPYVSPAAVLPTVPRRRLVDAGYYDNYGVDLVTGWLRETVTRAETRSWLEKNVSRILIVQIRDSVSELAVNPDDARAADPPVEPGPLAAGLEGLTSPIAAVLSARESVMLFRNDGQLEAVTKLCKGRLSADFLTTTIFELKGETSLSWYLTEAEIGAIKAQAQSEGIRGKLEAVSDWLTL